MASAVGGGGGPSPVKGLGNIYNSQGSQNIQNEAQTANTVVDSYQQVAQQDSQGSGSGSQPQGG